MKQRKSSTSIITLGLVLLVLVVPAAAQNTSAAPQLPHAFIGIVEVEGLSAPDGLVVEVVGPGVQSGISGNPVSTLSGGVFGRLGMTEQKLLVQGDVESGTPLEFYVGGVKAEVFPVATNGPWLEAFPYIPGEVTELNLRIISQPSVGGTREPTPVQTRIPSGQVPAIAGYTGPALPQPEVIATYQPGEAPADSQPTVPLQGDSGQPSSQGGSTTAPGQSSPETDSAIPATRSVPGMLTGTAIVAFLVIIGAAVYQRSRQTEEKKEE